MRYKTLLLSTLGLGLVALALVQFNRTTPTANDAQQPLVAANTFNRLKVLTVKANNKSVTIEKSADGWTVKEKLSLPVDMDNRLLPLLRSLQKAKDLGPLTTNAKRLERLGLTESAITLTTDDGKQTTLQFGKQTEDGVGASARRGDQPAAIRTDFTGALEGDPALWVDLNLFVTTPANIKAVSFTWKDGTATYTRKELGALFDGKEGNAVEDIVATLATVRAADAIARTDPAVASAGRSAEVKLTLFDGSVVTLRFAKGPVTPPNESPKTFVQVAHSDPKHKANALAQQAAFIAVPWLAEQIPASLADFKKGQTPGPEAAAPMIQIPGPSPTLITSPNIKLK